MDIQEIKQAIGLKAYYENENGVLYNADCLSVMAKMPDKCVDLVLTDPPYGIDIAKNPFRQKHEKQDWDNKPCSENQISEMQRVSKEQIIWGGNYFKLNPSQCFYVWDKKQPENFSSAMCEMAWVSKQSPAKIFHKWVVSYEKQHPTQKPDELMEWCLRLNECNIIFDPFLGSGTTAVACEKLGRKWVGVEISEKYCEIAAKRIQSENDQLKLF